MELKHFITFYSNGIIKTKQVTREIKSNEIIDVVIPEKIFALKTFDKATDDITIGKTKVICKGDILNEKLYYVGQILSLDDVKNEFGESSSDYKNLLKNDAIGAVKARDGLLVPLEKNIKAYVIAPEEVGIICLYNEDEFQKA